MQATIPDELEVITLEDTVNGESVYVVPWALYADNDGYLWLNGGYTFENYPRGTSRMKVSKKKEKYICDMEHYAQTIKLDGMLLLLELSFLYQLKS